MLFHGSAKLKVNNTRPNPTGSDSVFASAFPGDTGFLHEPRATRSGQVSLTNTQLLQCGHGVDSYPFPYLHGQVPSDTVLTEESRYSCLWSYRELARVQKRRQPDTQLLFI